MLTDVSLSEMMLRILALLIISGLYGFAVAGCARLLGDMGPTYDGRLTLNPFAHIELFAFVAILFARVGWIRPVALDASKMRGGLAGLIACVVVPSVGLLLLAMLLARLRGFPVMVLDPSASMLAVNGLNTIAECAIWFAFFNLIPFPPLAAGAVLVSLWPKAGRILTRNRFWIGFALTALLIAVGGSWLAPFAATVFNALVGF